MKTVLNSQTKAMIRQWVPRYLIHLIHFVVHLIRLVFKKKYRSNHSLLRVSRLYVNRIAPAIAIHLSWILWPVYIVIKKARLVFLINNISSSVGHVVTELDYFFRRLEEKEIAPDRRYVVLWPRSEVSRYAAKVYRRNFYTFIANDLAYSILLPFIMRYPDITVDCGLSDVDLVLKKCQVPRITSSEEKRTKSIDLRRPYMEVWDRYVNYYRLRAKTRGFYPMKPRHTMSEELLNYLGISAAKYAVIQIKTETVNATAEVIDPRTYIDAVELLRGKGYALVFAGREQMPKAFELMDILNYAEWDKANFCYDLELIAGSHFVLSSGSGFTMLADTIGIPFVSCNSWHIAVPPPSQLCVTVPTLLYKDNQNIMRFSEQIELFYCRGESNSPPTKSTKPRNATSDEILEAAKEALSLKENICSLSDLQRRFKVLRPKSPLYVAESRISQYFIERFQEFL